MKKLVFALGLISMLPFQAFADGPLDSFAGTYTLLQGTQGMNASGDLVCPSPLIFRVSLGALDSNMPQLPQLQVATLQAGNTKYTGSLSSDGSTFNYKNVEKTSCAFLGLFCSTSTEEGTLAFNNAELTLMHSESTSEDGILSSGNCIYTKQAAE
jgi:hypothetical protein